MKGIKIMKVRDEDFKEKDDLSVRYYSKLSSACHNYLEKQLQIRQKPIVLDFDPISFIQKHPEGGFVEKFCLSSEERKKVQLVRKKNKI